MKKNGFTLIELLAVIVILAVIALIVTPIVTGIIGSSKTSADARSAEAYVKAAETYFAGSEISQEKKQKIGTNIINDIDLGGVTNRQGYVSVNDKGQVKMAIIINNKCYKKQETQGISEISITGDNLDTCISEFTSPLPKIQFKIAIPYASIQSFEVTEGSTWNDCINNGPCKNIVMVGADNYVIYGPNEISGDVKHPHFGDQYANPAKGDEVIKKDITYSANTILCFLAGTKVLTKNGLINIEDIKVGDYVYSYNEETNIYSYNMVTLTHKNTVMKDKTTITINGEQITSTSNHNYYTKNRGWVAAKDLTVNDELLSSNNEIEHIEKVETITSDKEYIVYNLSIENNHTYFVGNNSVLVHNAPESTTMC